MEFRKLVKSGQTSYTVSLPIAWVQRHRLKARDVVTVREEGDLLVLSAVTSREEDQQSATIAVDRLPAGTFDLALGRAYMQGARRIILQSRDVGRVQERMRHLLPHYPGLEFEERDAKRVVYQNYFDLQSATLPQLAQKGRMILLALFDTVNEALAQSRTGHLAVVMSYFDSLLRQHTLVMTKVLQARAPTKEHLGIAMQSSQLVQVGERTREFLNAVRFPEMIVGASGLLEQFKTLRLHTKSVIVEGKHEMFLLLEAQAAQVRALARQARTVQECIVFEALASLSDAVVDYARTAFLFQKGSGSAA